MQNGFRIFNCDPLKQLERYGKHPKYACVQLSIYLPIYILIDKINRHECMRTEPETRVCLNYYEKRF